MLDDRAGSVPTSHVIRRDLGLSSDRTTAYQQLGFPSRQAAVEDSSMPMLPAILQGPVHPNATEGEPQSFGPTP